MQEPKVLSLQESLLTVREQVTKIWTQLSNFTHCTSQSILQIQCNLYQNPHETFLQNRNINSKIHMNSQGIPRSQENPEKEEHTLRADIY